MITAKVIKDSYYKNHKGTTYRVTTLECEYPRFILSELNTHRQLSKNSSSSRAIPIKRMNSLIMDSNTQPEFWGKNHPGMQAYQELDQETIKLCERIWQQSKAMQIKAAQELSDLGLHKQIANRLTEPFHQMKTLITATCWDNFFNLRLHPTTQPEFRILAEKIELALAKSKPEKIETQDWHLPYIDTQRIGNRQVYSSLGSELTLKEALMLSVSCCAQVSYRNLDLSIEKAERIYKQLIESNPKHLSPSEHQAQRPLNIDQWPLGITHQTRSHEFYSANFRGFIQLRKLIE